MKRNRAIGVFLCLFAVSLLLLGCGEKASVTTMITADNATLKTALLPLLKCHDVALEDIESLTITVTQIILVPMEEEEPEGEVEGEGEAEGEGEGEPILKGNNKVPDNHVLVYGDEDDPPFDLNLMDLVGVSEIVNTAEIPAGTYKQIRLSVENPRLVLVGGDPATPLTNIQLTANGRLFCTQPEGFTFVAGVQNTVMIDLGGIHLVETGAGKYVFTPQLRATVEVITEEIPPDDGIPVIVSGIVVGVDIASSTLSLELADLSLLTVDYSSATFDPPLIISPLDLLFLPAVVDGVDVGGTVVAGIITH